MYKRKNLGWEKHLDFILIDVLSLQYAFVLCYYIYVTHIPSSMPLYIYENEEYRTISIILFILSFAVAIGFNTMHNVIKRGNFIEFYQTVKQAVLVYAGLIFILFVIHTSNTYSRLILSFTAVAYIPISYLLRLLWKKFLLSTGGTAAKKTMILVTNETNIPHVLERTGVSEDAKIVGVVLTNRDAEGETVYDLPIVANIEDAAMYICRKWVDEVFFYPDTYPNFSDSSDKVATFIKQCREMAVPTHIRISFSGVEGKSFIEKVNGFNVITTTANYASPLQLLAKRVTDILGGLVGSFFALLIMLIVGPIIKIKSPGPTLFKQERIGQNGKHFKMYKIRSMYMDAEERKKELMAQNRVADGMMFKLDFDPRIIGNEILPDGTKKTGIGEFIRKTSLDEFPQFFNVLKGDMSLVGTRPPTLDEWEKYEYHHRARLSTRPGITGMWQVSGRSKITDFEEIVKLDTEYINNWSLSLDVKILFKTVLSVLRHDGAM